MKFELHAFLHITRYRVAIAALSTLVGKFCQIVGLELNTVDLIIATQFLDLLLSLLRRERVLAILIARELLVELLLREFLAPLFLRTEGFGDGEERHDGVVVETIGLHLVENLQSICHRLRHIAEDIIHLLTSLEPLLL